MTSRRRRCAKPINESKSSQSAAGCHDPTTNRTLQHTRLPEGERKSPNAARHDTPEHFPSTVTRHRNSLQCPPVNMCSNQGSLVKGRFVFASHQCSKDPGAAETPTQSKFPNCTGRTSEQLVATFHRQNLVNIFAAHHEDTHPYPSACRFRHGCKCKRSMLAKVAHQRNCGGELRHLVERTALQGTLHAQIAGACKMKEASFGHVGSH